MLTGNSFQSLLTLDDQHKFLECVKRHLTPNGLFAFNMRAFCPSELVTTNDYHFWHEFNDDKGLKVDVFGKQIYDPETKIVHYWTKRVWPDHQTVCKISLLYSEPKQVIDLLTKHGFEITSLYSSFDRQPFTSISKALIPVCCLNK